MGRAGLSQPLLSASTVVVGRTPARLRDAVPRWFVGSALILCVVLMMPLFATRIPPLLDFPNHVAEMDVIAHAASDPILAKFFTIHWTVVANSGVELVMPILLRWFPLWTTGRFFLVLALLVPLAGIIAYSRVAFGRWSAWSLGGGLVAYNTLFLLGFMNFVIGLGLALLAAAAWMAWRERFPVRTILAGILAALALFFFHLFALLYFALLIGAHELLALQGPPGRRWPTPRAVLGRLLPDALLFVLPAVLLATSTLADTTGPTMRVSLKLKLGELFFPFLTYDQTADRLVMLLVIAIMAGLLIRRRARIAAPAALVFAVLLLVWPFIPHVYKQTAYIDARFPIMAGFLLFAGFAPRRLPPRLAVAIFGLIAVVTVVRVGLIALVWAGHNQDLAELQEVIAHVPPGSVVLAVDAPSAQVIPYWRAHRRNWLTAAYIKTYYQDAALLLIERRALWPRLFTGLGKQPVVVKPDYQSVTAPEGELPDYHELAADTPSAAAVADAPYLSDWWQKFDYVLVLAAGAAPDLAALRPDRLEPVAQTEFAALFRVRRDSP
jgi:hypothetical protein